MPHDNNSCLWTDSAECFFRDQEFTSQPQSGSHCVSTSLAILTGSQPEKFQGVVNTQDPHSWSDALREWEMQLAYCPTDARKLECYMPELIELDDLFTLSYYTPHNPEDCLQDPDPESGWVCGSHIVVMHRDKILDPYGGMITDARDHSCNNRHTKRIFRVVPADYHRRL